MINREYKDRLFSFLFGDNSRKEWTLSLYNAINGSNYSNPDELEINTLEEVLFMGMKNDVSFIIGGHINLYEHQSSYNPNMPLRELVYIGHLYDKYVKQHKANIYSTRIIKLPVPKLVVFYNGVDDMPEETTLELKDAFMDGVNPNESDVNVRVRVLNVHSDKNRKLMDACRPLYEYSMFIDSIYKYRKLMDIKDAVNKALNEMPKDWIIRDCLLINKAEVTLMILTEYNEEETMQMLREEAWEDGKEEGVQQGIQLGKQEGVAEGRFQIIVDLVNDKILSLEEAASRVDMTIEEFKKRIQK